MAARRNLLPVFLARAATVISPHRAPTQERAGTAGDAEFVRACAAVLASLAAVHKALADEATRAAESVVPLVAQDVREAEDALADAGSSLASLGGVLRRVRCCSSQQQAHYGAMLQQLEERRADLLVAIAREKTLRMGELAAAHASRTAAPQTLQVAGPSAPLFGTNTTSAVDDEDDVDLKLTDAQRNELAEENAQMIARQQSRVTEQAHEIQRQLESLSQLMTVFSLEVVRQKEGMLRIIDATVRATHNVEQGNAKLVEATSTSVDFRVMVLLFLVIMSFTLVFLHWYS